jgi:UDP-glucose 4-epimerase
MTVCLVTGGAGFIGSHLVEALLARGHAVRVLDNFSSGTLANLSRVLDAIELYPGDLSDLDFVRERMVGAELVFHLATPNRWPDRLSNPVAARYADALGTIHVLSAARETRVRRVVFASSARVYGPAPGQKLSEVAAPAPVDPYAVAKWTGEQACITCTQIYGLETVRLRYFNVYGPRQSPVGPYAGLVPRVLKAMLAGQPPVLSGRGLETQDLLCVDDAVHATVLAAEAPRVAGKVYNVARGLPTTGRVVVETVNAILATRIEPTYSAAQPPDDLDNLADTTQAETALGFCASTSLEQGLRRCIEASTSWGGHPPHRLSLRPRIGNER